MENTCNYVDQHIAERGIQYDEDLFSHTIYNNSLCIQTDDEKNSINIADLDYASELPIYCIFAHGNIISDVDVIFDDDMNTHIKANPNTFFNLERHQYVYDTSPLGGLLLCSTDLNDYLNRITQNTQEFVKILFSTNYKLISSPVGSKDFDLETPLFSPPLFTTINKSLNFYDDSVSSPLQFGVIQLNEPISYNVSHILESIGKKTITTTTDEEKLARFLNLAGNLTNNPEAEMAFVQHLMSNRYKCTLAELTSIFGPGIYIMSTCSPLNLSLNVDSIGKIKYSSHKGIITKLKNPAHAEIVEKSAYAFNNDLETIVYNLNNRWFEMVQGRTAARRVASFPPVHVIPSDHYKSIADIREYAMDTEEDEVKTQPDEDEYMTGGKRPKNKKKRNQTKRNQTKRHKKRATKKRSTKHQTKHHRRPPRS